MKETEESSKSRQASQKHQKWREEHRQEIIDRAKQWVKDNPERAKQIRRRHWEKVKSDPDRYAKRKEKQREYQRNYYKGETYQNRIASMKESGEYKTYSKEKYEANKEQRQEYARRYYQSHREEIRERIHKRRKERKEDDNVGDQEG